VISVVLGFLRSTPRRRERCAGPTINQSTGSLTECRKRLHVRRPITAEKLVHARSIPSVALNLHGQFSTYLLGPVWFLDASPQHARALHASYGLNAALYCERSSRSPLSRCNMSRESTALLNAGVLARQFFSKAAPLSAQQFRSVFERLRNAYPADMARLCIAHIAENGLDPLGRKVFGWLCSENLYMGALLDSEFLSLALAQRVLEVFRVSDSQFSSRFSEVLTPDGPNFDRSVLPRALDLLLGLEDYQTFVGILKVLTTDSDPYVRSKAVKALCQIRPTKAVVERQMQQPDPRVRANAIEAMWHVASDEAAAIFRSAATDCNHRIAFNALLGLYFLNDATALQRMLELATSNSVEFRRAAVWAFGFIADSRTRSALEKLQLDPSPAVRLQASRALAKLGREPEAITECAQPLDQLATPELSAPNLAAEVHSLKVALDSNSRAKTDSLSAPEFKLL
jgi:hypothetical protein